MIAAWENRFAPDVIRLWNEEMVRDGYKEMTDESFGRIFLSSPYFDPEGTFVLLEHGRVAGFACGCAGDDLPLGNAAGYLTCVAANPGAGQEDRYALLLGALERRFLELGKTQADALFFNPMQLPWYIPCTPGHEHNNAPGIPSGSALHAFLLRRGYAERAVQCAMYLPLGGFTVPEEIKARQARAGEIGYSVGLYESSAVGGLGELLEGLGNPLWTAEIARCAAEGIPFVVAAHEGRAAGFAGPVIRQANGRGYFAGIGVHPAHEGHGLGTVLFFRLCEAFREIGTDYMSLYTGSSNPALRIYEKAGFRTVKTFATMRRELRP